MHALFSRCSEDHDYVEIRSFSTAFDPTLRGVMNGPLFLF